MMIVLKIFLHFDLFANEYFCEIFFRNACVAKKNSVYF